MSDTQHPAKQNTKALQAQKRRRRQFITSVRMVRYGVNNFTRNAWLTVAATAVMTVTLLLIFMSVAAQNMLQNTVQEIGRKVDMSIYLKTGTTEEQAQSIVGDLRQLDSVTSVTFISSDQALTNLANENKAQPGYLNAITEADNKIPATIRVNVEDINDTSELEEFIKTDQDLQQYLDPDRAPSFAGEKRQTIEQIARWTLTAQTMGLIASTVFVCLSALIIFNTIRMAIFSRKEEIQMMKLIGADKQFIRGPFLAEAMMYGFFAALFATGIGYALLYFGKGALAHAGIGVEATLHAITLYIGIVLLAMIVLGSIIGVVSAVLATRRHLKL